MDKPARLGVPVFRTERVSLPGVTSKGELHRILPDSSMPAVELDMRLEVRVAVPSVEEDTALAACLGRLTLARRIAVGCTQ